MRQLHDASRFIAYRRHVAYFSRRKQTFVLGIVEGNGVEEINVFDRGQAFDLEIAQPPEMQALPHHGMQPAIELVFLISFGLGS